MKWNADNNDYCSCQFAPYYWFHFSFYTLRLFIMNRGHWNCEACEEVPIDREKQTLSITWSFSLNATGRVDPWLYYVKKAHTRTQNQTNWLKSVSRNWMYKKHDKRLFVILHSIPNIRRKYWKLIDRKWKSGLEMNRKESWGWVKNVDIRFIYVKSHPIFSLVIPKVREQQQLE